jgi:hypothetical protein
MGGSGEYAVNLRELPDAETNIPCWYYQMDGRMDQLSWGYTTSWRGTLQDGQVYFQVENTGIVLYLDTVEDAQTAAP